MNCELIFYLATKTNLCEKSLKNSVKYLDLNFRTALFATEPEVLGKLIIDAFEKTNIVFIVGGLDNSEKNGTENILSKALANKLPDDLKKLKNPVSDADGYLVRQGGQLLIALPDKPEEIEEILSGPLNNYLENFTEL
ncbi:MAG: hypothetical protein J1E41_04410 [Ruminococcus sp.]|nr:hypothetical protein [Ruminococcus sp.]